MSNLNRKTGLVGENGRIFTLQQSASETPPFVHAFVTSTAQYIKILKELTAIYKANPTVIIWVSWYKKSAGLATDVTETTIRNYALQHDLVDVKVCAVSDQWSGLKLVVRKELRGH